MSNRLIRADAWNHLVERVQRARSLRGVRCRISERSHGAIVTGEAHSSWNHPWQVRATYQFNDDGEGEWRAFVRPGFVNGRDAHIGMPENWSEKGAPAADVTLTNEPAPYLVLKNWRNPLAPAGIEATLSGSIVAKAAEGYPPFFAKLGVKPAATGGNLSKPGALESEDDLSRTRELRAMDIVLSKPRIGTRLDVRVGDPLLDAQTEFIDTVFVSDYLRTTQGRARLRATSKYTPVDQDQSLPLLYGTLLRAGDPQFDELHIATVWIVSPPGAAPDARPDHTWTPYPQHFVFWNLNHATRIVPPSAPQPPLTLRTGLAGGVGDRINDALLSFINDSNAEAQAFLNQADARGTFWST